MKQILLNKNVTAKVDDEDYKLLNLFIWRLWIDHHGYHYAIRDASVSGGLTASDTVRIYMHRYVMDVPDTLQECREKFGHVLYVVHKDGNGLNNQRNNLIISRSSQVDLNT